MKQKDIFLDSEADAWLSRNAEVEGEYDLQLVDSLCVEVLQLPLGEIGRRARILEIGCGDGRRLKWLQDQRGFECHGVEPSKIAVEVANAKGVAVKRGTAEQLPFEDRSFDVVMFGFCLYLCDREDLFRIACEADRVLRNPGWLLILDFYYRGFAKRRYRHREGILSHKMDYSSLFSWNPGYALYSQKIRHHETRGYTDDAQEWVAISVLRKNFSSDR